MLFQLSFVSTIFELFILMFTNVVIAKLILFFYDRVHSLKEFLPKEYVKVKSVEKKIYVVSVAVH